MRKELRSDDLATEEIKGKAMKAVEIKSATEATEVAVKFIKKDRWWVRPLKAVRENGTWLVEVDVGPLSKIVATLKIDAQSGKIIEYNIPE